MLRGAVTWLLRLGAWALSNAVEKAVEKEAAFRFTAFVLIHICSIKCWEVIDLTQHFHLVGKSETLRPGPHWNRRA